MTAEIGVLNTIGVALAADSAVTIGGSKIFNSADKLFSLSKHHPVGIMIYGNAEFMGVPWETVIKIYRKNLSESPFSSLKEYSDDFLNFLIRDSRFYNRNYEKILISNKFRNFLDDFLNNINIVIPDIFRVEPNENQIKQMIFAESYFYADYFNNNFPIARGFGENFYETFFLENVASVQEVVHSRINIEVDPETMNYFVIIAANLVMREIFMNPSGIVIAGFGEDDIFPSLKSYSIEGIFNGVLKYKDEHDFQINADSQATIVPFAQQEMVHSFLEGIDPDLKRDIIGLVERITEVYPKAINDNIITLDDNQYSLTEGFGRDLLQQFVDHLERTIYGSFSSPIMDTVASFPKEELAAMAEALVNLTSIKRKMSFQSETVGGPIDVAVISKGDGFIWIKRKHYFQPELNHTYFSNYMKR